MKYLKLYEEINPDRISDDTFEINSNLLDLRKNNKFYISSISCIEKDVFIEDIVITFYNPNITIYGIKLISVTIQMGIDISEDFDLEVPVLLTIYGEVGPQIKGHVLDHRKVVDILFTEKSLKDLLDFIKADSPNYYEKLKDIKYSEIKEAHRKLLLRL